MVKGERCFIRTVIGRSRGSNRTATTVVLVVVVVVVVVVVHSQQSVVAVEVGALLIVVVVVVLVVVPPPCSLLFFKWSSIIRSTPVVVVVVARVVNRFLPPVGKTSVCHWSMLRLPWLTTLLVSSLDVSVSNGNAGLRLLDFQVAP